MKVVTSGDSYIDIDAYASSVAYAELLNLVGQPALAASSAVLNESITASLRTLTTEFRSDYLPKNDDEFILVDISDPEYFDKIVANKKVVEILDHHPGFEKFWEDKIGNSAQIEFIGAAATLIFEQWQKQNKLTFMSQATAQLLAAAILDNTLNFKAKVTTKRDRLAFDFLSRHGAIDDNWVTNYFSDCQNTITKRLSPALTNDTKTLRFNSFGGQIHVGQMVVWDARSLIENKIKEIKTIAGDMGKDWLVNIVSISDGSSYFVTDNSAVRLWLANLLGVKFSGDIAIADRLWLRKEILKADQN